MVARRSGDRFFVGAGTNSEGRSLNLELSFLKSGVKYEAEIYSDVAGAPDKVEITRRVVTSADIINIDMAPTGGQAISFIPVR